MPEITSPKLFDQIQGEEDETPDIIKQIRDSQPSPVVVNPHHRMSQPPHTQRGQKNDLESSD